MPARDLRGHVKQGIDFRGFCGAEQVEQAPVVLLGCSAWGDFH